MTADNSRDENRFDIYKCRSIYCSDHVNLMARMDWKERDDWLIQIVVKHEREERVKWKWRSIKKVLIKLTWALCAHIEQFPPTHTHTHTHSVFHFRCTSTFLNPQIIISAARGYKNSVAAWELLFAAKATTTMADENLSMWLRQKWSRQRNVRICIRITFSHTRAQNEIRDFNILEMFWDNVSTQINIIYKIGFVIFSQMNAEMLHILSLIASRPNFTGTLANIILFKPSGRMT